MRSLETRIPPPILLALVGVAMWLGARGLPNGPPGLRLPIALAFAFAGLAVAGLGMAAFRRARTTINPLNPEAATSIVKSGIFAHTRNPMYVGMAALLIGWAVYLGSVWLAVGPAAFALFINRFQIIPEERALTSKFGDAYGAYRRSVRRWV